MLIGFCVVKKLVCVVRCFCFVVLRYFVLVCVEFVDRFVFCVVCCVCCCPLLVDRCVLLVVLAFVVCC